MIRRRGASAAALWLALPAVPSSSSLMVSPGGTSFGFRSRLGGSSRKLVCSACHEVPPHCKWKHPKRSQNLQLSMTAASSAAECASEEADRLPPVSQMPLPKLLQLLNKLGVRHAPDATRAELEKLALDSMDEEGHHSSASASPPVDPSPIKQSAVSASSNHGEPTDDVVDAVVLDDLQDDQDPVERRETSGRGERRNVEHQFSPRPPQRWYNKHRRQPPRRRYARLRDEDRAARQSDYYQNAYGHRRRQYPPQEHYRRDDYDLYSNYDQRARGRGRDNDLDEFNLNGDNDRRKDQIYDDGMQIFLMGFYEAGKTATQLALDKVVDSVNPFVGEDGSGDWWHDEERGRDVLDVDVLDFSPRRETEQRRRRRRGRRTEPPRETSGQPPQSERGRRSRSREQRYGRNQRPKYGSAYSEYTMHPKGSTTDGDQIRRGEESVEDIPKQPMSSLRHDEKESHHRPNYDLYQQDSREQAESTHRYEKQWKDRLRHKFDAALGLQPPPSSSTPTETYYGSWKSQMKGMDEDRKEVVRQQMNQSKASTGGDPEQSNAFPKNRRARMRAKSSKGPPSSTKSRLDEVPFWRKRGTIASLLFDTAPTSADGPSPMKRKSLEQLILSPFGRDHTVTSLFVYISRTILTSFGIMCRWAGVRGTIPQPIVVSTVFAMLVSSRRGQRAVSLTLTLLALRLVGEFIHGSLHGNEFWDDEYDFKAHDWKDRSVN
ncbi:hypothetical protein ACHAWF_017099 [Thalassiosira exigua]